MKKVDLNFSARRSNGLVKTRAVQKPSMVSSKLKRQVDFIARMRIAQIARLFCP